MANTTEELSAALAEVRRLPRLTVKSDHTALVQHLNGALTAWCGA